MKIRQFLGNTGRFTWELGKRAVQLIDTDLTYPYDLTRKPLLLSKTELSSETVARINRVEARLHQREELREIREHFTRRTIERG